MTPVDIHADLDCELDSAPFSIRSSGRKIVVEVPDLATGMKLFHVGLPRGSWRRRLSFLKRSLDQLILVVEVKIAGITVMKVGHQTGSRLWNCFGMPRLTFKCANMIRACSAKGSLD
ncbi:hypothetical protein [Adhaeretor mobilis]|uniref:Uncharacterized protein n=1 Tax=Adhaeretor mobilis TaxID=1930276 RepID=A0A517MPS5_9BACT|nr:hypothetical protein [Adhaeretor mobilis]QDS96885.1 hypothetical protein HG15A2_01440 [Adhaeretor mobilis]